ncbi:MAG TPA: DUF2865 domain-containing protein [Methylocystis sp.]|nr:DUF2865 domain-containing protein [Methylocystis sp.]
MRRTALPTKNCFGARLLLVALALNASPVAAESPYCSDLRAQIARAGQGSPRYRAAAAKQQAELARAVNYSRGIGCERQQFLFFGEAPPAQCGQLAARIAQMRANLASLDARGDDVRKQALQARYDEQCRPRQVQPVSFLEQLFGGGSAPAPPPVEQAPATAPTRLERLPEPRDAIEEQVEDERPLGGSEAVCVRSCDGAFFPITYSAKRSNLDDLNALCRALCPGADAELYTKGPWKDIDSAVSFRGDAYSDLPNALKFQKTRDKSCSCKPKGQDWAEALGEAERLFEETYAKDKDTVVTAEEAERLSRPTQPSEASQPPRNGKARPARSTTPVASVSQAASPSSVQSIGPAQGEVRETVGPDGVKRRVRVVAPAL